MLVVLSDLHFSEAQSTKVGDLQFNKNLPADNYRAYFLELNQIAVSNRIRHVDMVLAGDIFELSRSGLWFESDERPYRSNASVAEGSAMETTILKILQAIAHEERVRDALTLFKNVRELFNVEVQVHYLPGNHDRLINATSQTRAAARDLLGLAGGGELFAHRFIYSGEFGQPFCLVRHGHEYDPMNFSLDTHLLEEIPTDFSEEVYGAVSLGDVTTVEFGAALPYYFMQSYGAEAIQRDPILLALYERLMAFDDVRPTSALLPYLFSTPGVKKKKTWVYMEPCFKQVIRVISKTPEFVEAITSIESLPKSQRILLKGLLNSNLMQQGVPYWMVKQLMKRVSSEIKLSSQVKWAKREALVKDKSSGCQCVISGHTHVPEVSLMSAKKGNERYYINTGTWRNVIPATKNFQEFGRLKSLAKVIVFGPVENENATNEMPWSFHFLSGVNYGNHRHL